MTVVEAVRMRALLRMTVVVVVGFAGLIAIENLLAGPRDRKSEIRDQTSEIILSKKLFSGT